MLTSPSIDTQGQPPFNNFNLKHGNSSAAESIRVDDCKELNLMEEPSVDYAEAPMM